VYELPRYEWRRERAGRHGAGAATAQLHVWELMKDIPEGQLFWIIKNGSPVTGILPFSGLSHEEVWQLIHDLRSLAQ
jgi:hypothetical protein